LSLFGGLEEDPQSQQCGILTVDIFSLGGNGEAFAFDTPSPDDVLNEAREQGKSNASASMRFSNSCYYYLCFCIFTH